MSELDRIKIEYGGGAPYSAKVTNAKTGELIPGVYRVDFSLDANRDAPVVTLYAYAPSVDVTVDASMRMICPHCGQKVSNQQQKERSNDGATQS